MDVHLSPEVEARLHQLATATGRAANELIEDAMASYFDELAQVQTILDRRFDDVKSGRVQALDGETFFEGLRGREEQLKGAPIRES